MKKYWDEKEQDYICYVSDTVSPIAVVPLDDYILKIKFSDGLTKIYDVKPLLNFGVFKKLQNPLFFKTVDLVCGTVGWDNGDIDIAPETLYEDGALV
ncbi:hypothetical protein AGMMS49938_08090 [Fibrobacterales bacterium]|nr:hypothetical protein AGMMS49938_08090 [Fibrobacterales bacterium]